MTTLTHPPGTIAPWMQAMETQLAAYRLIQRMIDLGDPKQQWDVDKVMLEGAVPFAWSRETIQATMAAGQSIPLESLINRWNLNTNAAWWWFAEPLPFQTVNTVHGEFSLEATQTGIRALNFGWFEAPAESVVIPAGAYEWMLNDALMRGPMKRYLGISAWMDDPLGQFTIVPSQTILWNDGDTLATTLVKMRAMHIELYGPGGRLEKAPQVGVEIFMRAAEGMARFLLAGLAWLNQRVLLEGAGPIERHRRKDFNRHLNQQLDTVRVVQLRRVERKPTEDAAEPGEKREYGCHWVVGGHWRNQTCGPKHGDRRLTWIHPYLKGDLEKPLHAAKPKVYVVNR